MAKPPKMIMSGTARIVVKRRMLPRWSRSQLNFIACLPCLSSTAEFDCLDVLPGDVDAAARCRAAQKHAAEVHVVRLDAGAIRQEDGGGGADVGVGDVRGQRAVLDRLPRE